ncbi:unnamed protein product [Rotaria socialis]|uniref:Uncharacterized protein n=2 Tax=Rotaria socialis TaxID=392032 RepID=A0A818DVF7_9BILA|nr:unnamed protein product [Rotaria socialis]CAF3368712.1 unnamed protein product [Rotaria socialis]CAF3448128.1 unnamed protein product [Rotaria socialis]CAF3575668.1 unnamed protein product [Rotaria socialis]CAF3678311.1 unnamed protein product [Rotaria socialis]
MFGDEPTGEIREPCYTNRYGNDEEVTSTTDAYYIERDRRDNTIRRCDLCRDPDSNLNTAYGSIRANGSCINNAPIHSRSSQETSRYLQRFGNDIYFESNPEIIRSATTEAPATYKQRVSLRCLQPPPLPPPEPNIIIEKRPEQPPPPPSLVIHEHEQPRCPPPPIIFRERPPPRPAPVPGKTTIRPLPPVPVPPRSLVVERFPAPEMPPDIILERWTPYGPPPERRTIVKPAPPPMKYPRPTHTVVIHDEPPVHVVRKFEYLGVTQECPDAYVRRYGSSLLDSQTFLREARNAGVTENIACPCPVASTSTIKNEPYNICQSNEMINQGCCSYHETRPCSYQETRPCSYEETRPCSYQQARPYSYHKTRPYSYQEARPCSYQEARRCSCQGTCRCSHPYDELKTFWKHA